MHKIIPDFVGQCRGNELWSDFLTRGDETITITTLKKLIEGYYMSEYNYFAILDLRLVVAEGHHIWRKLLVQVLGPHSHWVPQCATPKLGHPTYLKFIFSSRCILWVLIWKPLVSWVSQYNYFSDWTKNDQVMDKNVVGHVTSEGYFCYV